MTDEASPIPILVRPASSFPLIVKRHCCWFLSLGFCVKMRVHEKD